MKVKEKNINKYRKIKWTIEFKRRIFIVFETEIAKSIFLYLFSIYI